MFFFPRPSGISGKFRLQIERFYQWTCLCYLSAFILYGIEQLLLYLIKRVYFFVYSKEKEKKKKPLLPFTLAPPCIFKEKYTEEWHF